MALLEIKNLHVKVDGKKILNGLDLTVEKGAGARHHGPERLRQVDARPCARGQGRLRGHRRAGAVRRRGPAGAGARRARRQGPVPGVPVSARNPRRRHHDVPAHRAQCAAQEARRGGAVDARISRRVCEVAGKLGIDRDMLRRGVNVGFSGGEKKRNEILQMALLEPRLVRARRDRFRPRHRRAQGRLPTASTGCARPSAPSSSSRIISGCSTTSCRTWCTCSRAAAS